MRQIYPELQALGAEVLVISFAAPERVTAYLAKDPQPFPVVADPTLTAYRAFSLGRVPVTTLFRPGVLGRFLKLMLRGWLPRRPGDREDVLQLGGDFVLDARGALRFAHPSAEPTDRPSAAELLAVVRQTCQTAETEPPRTS